MTNPLYGRWPVPLHAPSCHVPEIAMSGSVVELHCEDKLTVPPVAYNWYKDNRPLSTAQAPDINYSVDNKTGTLVLSENKQECYSLLYKGAVVLSYMDVWMYTHDHF